MAKFTLVLLHQCYWYSYLTIYSLVFDGVVLPRTLHSANLELFSHHATSQFKEQTTLKEKFVDGFFHESDFFSRGLFIIDEKSTLRQITMNDLPVGRYVALLVISW